MRFNFLSHKEKTDLSTRLQQIEKARESAFREHEEPIREEIDLFLSALGFSYFNDAPIFHKEYQYGDLVINIHMDLIQDYICINVNDISHTDYHKKYIAQVISEPIFKHDSIEMLDHFKWKCEGKTIGTLEAALKFAFMVGGTPLEGPF